MGGGARAVASGSHFFYNTDGCYPGLTNAACQGYDYSISSLLFGAAGWLESGILPQGVQVHWERRKIHAKHPKGKP